LSTGGRRVSRPEGNFFPRKHSNSTPKKNTKISFDHREFFSRPATTRKCSNPRSWMQEICIKMQKRMRKEVVPPGKSCRTQHCGNRIVRSPVTGYRVGPSSGNRICRSSVNGGTGCRTGLNSDSRDVRSPGNSYWMMKRPPVWRTYGRNRICTYRIHVDNYVSSTKLIRKIGIF
jgi:hypothetical protein